RIAEVLRRDEACADADDHLAECRGYAQPRGRKSCEQRQGDPQRCQSVDMFHPLLLIIRAIKNPYPESDPSRGHQPIKAVSEANPIALPPYPLSYSPGGGTVAWRAPLDADRVTAGLRFDPKRGANATACAQPLVFQRTTPASLYTP